MNSKVVYKKIKPYFLSPLCSPLLIYIKIQRVWSAGIVENILTFSNNPKM